MRPRAAVVVVGGGLVGGSLGAALRAAGGYRLRCIDLPERLATIERAGIFDEVADLAHGDRVLGEADLVVLAAPVAANAALLPEIGARVRTGTVVTDVGGTKRAIAALARGALGPEVRFVGGHPMAGSERGGVGAADPLLFVDRPYCLCPTPDSGEAALARMIEIVAAVGAVPVLVDADEHDRIVARVSHLPQLVAIAFAAAVDAAGLDPRMAAAVAGRGFEEATRLAASDLRMWRGVLAQNAGEVIAALDELAGSLAVVREGVRRGGALDEVWARAGRANRRLHPRARTDLGGIRDAIDGLDRELLRLVARRNGLAVRAGAEKRRAGLGLVDARREARLAGKWRGIGDALGLSPAATDALRELVVGEARRAQGEGA